MDEFEEFVKDYVPYVPPRQERQKKLELLTGGRSSKLNQVEDTTNDSENSLVGSSSAVVGPRGKISLVDQAFQLKGTLSNSTPMAAIPSHPEVNQEEEEKKILDSLRAAQIKLASVTELAQGIKYIEPMPSS